MCVYIYSYMEPCDYPWIAGRKKDNQNCKKLLVSCTSVVADILVILNSSNNHSKSL